MRFFESISRFPLPVKCYTILPHARVQGNILQFFFSQAPPSQVTCGGREVGSDLCYTTPSRAHLSGVNVYLKTQRSEHRLVAPRGQRALRTQGRRESTTDCDDRRRWSFVTIDAYNVPRIRGSSYVARGGLRPPMEQNPSWDPSSSSNGSAPATNGGARPLFRCSIPYSVARVSVRK